jgi:hypothetical protein
MCAYLLHFFHIRICGILDNLKVSIALLSEWMQAEGTTENLGNSEAYLCMPTTCVGHQAPKSSYRCLPSPRLTV